MRRGCDWGASMPIVVPSAVWFVSVDVMQYDR